jgi:hypothetical protein
VSGAEKPPIAKRAQALANSGDFEGFNALLPTLEKEYDAADVARLRRDMEVRRALTDLCAAARDRKRPTKR